MHLNSEGDWSTWLTGRPPSWLLQVKLAKRAVGNDGAISGLAVPDGLDGNDLGAAIQDERDERWDNSKKIN